MVCIYRARVATRQGVTRGLPAKQRTIKYAKLAVCILYGNTPCHDLHACVAIICGASRLDLDVLRYRYFVAYNCNTFGLLLCIL